jgi:hypothetical protein
MTLTTSQKQQKYSEKIIKKSLFGFTKVSELISDCLSKFLVHKSRN